MSNKRVNCGVIGFEQRENTDKKIKSPTERFASGLLKQIYHSADKLHIHSSYLYC